MDQDVQQIHDRLTNTQDKIDFHNRFMLPNAKAQQERDEMLGIGITPHISAFMDRYKQSEVERLTRKMAEVEAGKARVTEVLGEKMTPTLYQRLKAMFKSTSDFVTWYVNHDWTYWWVTIYIFRWVALFACMFLRVVNAGGSIWGVLQEFVARRFGIKASLTYIEKTMMPNIIAALVGSALVTFASRGLITFSGWIANVLGTWSLTARLISLFQLPGFTLDLVFVVNDVVKFVWEFAKAAGSEVKGGNFNPYTVATAGLAQATAVYCDTPLRTFFALAANFVGDFTIHMFEMVCKAVAAVLTSYGGQYAGAAANRICSEFGDMMKVVMTNVGRVPGQPEEAMWDTVTRMSGAGAGLTSMQLVGGALGAAGNGLPSA